MISAEDHAQPGLRGCWPRHRPPVFQGSVPDLFNGFHLCPRFISWAWQKIACKACKACWRLLAGWLAGPKSQSHKQQVRIAALYKSSWAVWSVRWLKPRPVDRCRFCSRFALGQTRGDCLSQIGKSIFPRKTIQGQRHATVPHAEEKKTGNKPSSVESTLRATLKNQKAEKLTS